MKGTLVILALLVSGCATVGKEIAPSQLAGFRKGETTIDEVVARLGTPTASSVTSTGQRTLSYVFAHTQVRPATFIPIVGLFAGGADSRSSVVVFTFAPDGRLQEYVASQSQVGTGTGAAARRYQQPNDDQPQEGLPAK